MLTVTHAPMWFRKHHGEKEERKMTRVYDPVIRWLLGGLTAVAGFFLLVLWNDHEMTTANHQDILSLKAADAEIKGAMDQKTSEIRQDLREIRRLLETRTNGH